MIIISIYLGTQQVLNIYSDHMPKDQYSVRYSTLSIACR